ncbi:hypothetical protein HC931_11900 [Candidatus Gracilibacteria bacterium]|nr:hypothetical protein [Candidatus Gracilibacteria bacterium]NJM90221.1 hypothetical protein [Hydrococcus sp. RU_2_2]NJP19255.1 hypothetical protein [Hydrococcus sp. CRU_1_1]
MKTVIIGGVCRTGKSRLANTIFTNTKSTIIHADNLTNFLKNYVPEKFSVDFQLDGVLKPDPREIVVKKLIRNMGKEFDYLKIIESSVITPTTVARHFQGDRYISLFLGYPHVDVLQKLNEIRQAAVNDRYCWSHQYSDREMIRYIKHFKQLSIEIEHICQQFDIQFVDTSKHWSNAIQIAYDWIIRQLLTS